MKKYLLLTAAAATAIVAAGPAMAGSLSGRAGVGAVNATPTTQYKLARELNFGSGVAAAAGQFDLIYTFLNGATPLTPGSYTVTISYAGATITTPLSTTPVAVTAAQTPGDRTAVQGPLGLYDSTHTGTENTTLTVTAQTSNSVTISLFIPAGNTVQAIFLNPAILVTGNVTITAATTNQVTGQAVDNSVISTLITTNNQGFAVGIDRQLTAASGTAPADNAGLDTRVAAGATGAFNNLSGDAQVGQVEVAVAGTTRFDGILGLTTASTPVFSDLNGTQVAFTDVSSLSIGVQGTLANYRFRHNSAGGAVSPAWIAAAANSVTIPVSGAHLNTAAGTITVEAANNGAGTPARLNPTDLPVSAALTLATGFVSPPATTGFFETIQTDGASYIVPWVATSNQAATTGNTTIIRVSNLASDYTTAGGQVWGQLYNPSNAAGVTNPGRSALLGTLGTSGEVVITSATLQDAFGDFGRGDIRLTVTQRATPLANQTTSTANAIQPGNATTLGSSNIVVKRILQNANGSQTEINVLPGDATSNANDPNTTGTRY